MIAFGRTMVGSHHEIDVALWRQPVQHTKDEYWICVGLQTEKHKLYVVDSIQQEKSKVALCGRVLFVLYTCDSKVIKGSEQ
jgi:hypothetical protein